MEKFLAKIRMVGDSFAILIPKHIIIKCSLAVNDTTYFMISKDKLTENDAKKREYYNNDEKVEENIKELT